MAQQSTADAFENEKRINHRLAFQVLCLSMALIGNLSELVDALSDLVASHIQLARIELKEDARFFGVRLALIAAVSPLILVGYGFLCVAAALALRRVIDADLAFLTIGLGNLAVGLGVIFWAGKQLSQRVPMQHSVEEIESTSLAMSPQGRRS